MITLYIISVVLFIAYISAIIIKFGIPCSISESSYLFGKNGNLIFWGGMTAIIIPMLIFWLEITAGQSYQFFVFLSCAALAFTAASGRYRGQWHTEWAVHTFGTLICAVCSQIWMWKTFKWSWAISIVILLIAYLIGSKIKGAKRSLTDNFVYYDGKATVFFVEMSCFLITFSSILIYYLK